VTFLPAHPDRAEAAVRAGGGRGGVSSGSQTVHWKCQRPDRLSPVSTHCRCIWVNV